MKKIILFGLSVCALHTVGHSQSNTTTQLPNGVIVHQAQGVEGQVEPVRNEPVKVRTIEDWTLPECMDALTILESKLLVVPESDRERYLVAKAQIVQRINELKTAN